MADVTVRAYRDGDRHHSIAELHAVRHSPLCVPYDADESLFSLAALDGDEMAGAVKHVICNNDALAARLSIEASGVTPATSLIIIRGIDVDPRLHGQGLPQSMMREVKAAFAGVTQVVALQLDGQHRNLEGDNTDPWQSDLHSCATELGFTPLDPSHPERLTAIWRADDVVPIDYGFGLFMPPGLSAESVARRPRD